MIPQGYPLYVEINDDGEIWPALVVGWVRSTNPADAEGNYTPVIVGIEYGTGENAVCFPVPDSLSWRPITAEQADLLRETGR